MIIVVMIGAEHERTRSIFIAITTIASTATTTTATVIKIIVMIIRISIALQTYREWRTLYYEAFKHQNALTPSQKRKEWRSVVYEVKNYILQGKEFPNPVIKKKR